MVRRGKKGFHFFPKMEICRYYVLTLNRRWNLPISCDNTAAYDNFSLAPSSNNCPTKSY